MTKYTVDDIKGILLSSDKALFKGLLRIYSLQTASEQAMKGTTDENGVGFSGCDATFMSSLAEQLIKRGSLSPKQIAALRKNLVRYARQLAKIANGQIQPPPLPAVKGMTFVDKPVKKEEQLEIPVVTEAKSVMPKLEW